MAQLTFSGLGSLATSAVGLGPTLGWFAGGMLGGSFQKKPLMEGPRLKDPNVQSAAYGMPIPIVYGMQKLAGNIIWSSGIAESAQKKRKYIGGQHVKLKLYHYHTSLALALCEGPIDSVLRIWADDELIYDAACKGGKRQRGKNPFKLRIYKGTQSQGADPLIAAREGISQTPAFRGLSYVVIENFCLDEYHGRVPQFTFEIATKSEEQFAQKTIALESLNQDQSFLSADGFFLYAVHGTRIIKVDRRSDKIVGDQSYETFGQEQDPQGKTLFYGRTLYDAKRNLLYSTAHRGNRTFIMVIHGETLNPEPIIYSLIGRDEGLIGFFDQAIVTVHLVKGTLHFYQYGHVGPILGTVNPGYPGGSGLNFSNHTIDSKGYMWFLSNNHQKSDFFHGVRLKNDGTFSVYKIEGHGRGYGIIFDVLTQKIFIIAHKSLLQINPDTGEVEKVMADGFAAVYSYSTYSAQRQICGQLYALDASGIYLIDTVAFKKVKFYPAKIWGKILSGVLPDDDNGCFWSAHQGLQKLCRGVYQPHPMTLKDVLIDLCRRAYVEAFDFEDNSVFDQPLYGFLLQGHEKIKHVLQMLMAVYQIQVREEKGALYFSSLHQKPSLALEAHKMGAYAESHKGESDISLVHKGSKEDLAHLSLIYQSLEYFYEHRVVEISRDEHKGGVKKIIALSLLLPDAHASTLGTQIFERENAESSGISLQLPPCYMGLKAGEVVSFMDGNRTRYARLESLILGANGLLKASGKMLTHLEPELFEKISMGKEGQGIDEPHIQNLLKIEGALALTLEGEGAFEGATLYGGDVEYQEFSGFITEGTVVRCDENLYIQFTSKLTPDIAWLFYEGQKHNVVDIVSEAEGYRVIFEVEALGFEMGKTLYVGSDENLVEVQGPGTFKAILAGHDDDDCVSLII